MTETIQNLIPIVALVISFISLYIIFSKKDNSSYFEMNINLLKKEIAKKDKSINELSENIKKQEDFFRSVKYSLDSNNRNLEKKVAELYERWIIVADDRITSIPQNNKEWWDAKEIIKQPKLKEWKPKNLSQSKSSFVNNGSSSMLEDEEEINQDFSEFSDEDFENIIDEDDEDTSFSSSTNNTQNIKPKNKKKKSNQMKM